MTYPKIDTRSIEQRLADRPVPKFSPEEIELFNAADRSKPFRLSLRNIFRSCAPDMVPIREMNREKVNRIDGTIVAIVSTSGHFESVKAVNVVPEALHADVEALFAQWLTAPCKLPPLHAPLSIEIPFLMRLD